MRCTKGKSIRTIGPTLAKLQQAGKIKRAGSGKKGRCEVQPKTLLAPLTHHRNARVSPLFNQHPNSYNNHHQVFRERD